MTIDELIMSGASKDEIAKALSEARMAKAKKDAEEAAARKAKENKTRDQIERLKIEGRAYLVNAIMAYGTAFGLIPLDYEVTQEELDKCEKLLMQIEEVIPLYITLAGVDKKLDKILKGEEVEDEDGDDDVFKRFFGGFGL